MCTKTKRDPGWVFFPGSDPVEKTGSGLKITLYFSLNIYETQVAEINKHCDNLLFFL